MSAATPPIDFLLVAPLDEEREALLAALRRGGGQPSLLAAVAGESSVYYRATLPVTSGDSAASAYALVVTSIGAMGQPEAAATVTAAIARWRPRAVVIVGIAGGIAANDVSLGDLVIAERLIGYELSKVRATGAEHRWQPYDVDRGLLQRARTFSGNRWHGPIARLRPGGGRPARHFGPIASGDKIIQDPALLADLLATWPKLVGVEMEGIGGAAGGRQASPPPALAMIRAVSDLADPDKESTAVKAWRPYACAVAAAFAIAFLSSGPLPVSATVPETDSALAPVARAPTAAGYSSVNVGLAAVTHFSEQQAAIIGQLTVQELDALREAAREGRRGEALARIDAIRAAPVRWSSLDPALQARVSQLEARIILDEDGDVVAARRRLETIRALDPASGALLDAQLAYRGGDPAGALNLVAGHADADSLHLAAVLRLVLGDSVGCLATLERVATADEATAETHRLRALAHLARRDLATAKEALAEALRLAPRWIVVNQARALLNYWQALSPITLPTGLVAWPLPPEWFLVRRDDDARAALRSAAETFGALAARASQSDERRELRRWEMACAGNDQERQGEAIELCRALLAEMPADPCALAWCRARGWAVDNAQGEAALMAALADGTATVAQMADLVALLIADARAAEAAEILDRPRLRDRLAAAGAADQWERLRTHAAAHSGDLHRAKVGTSARFATPEDLHARSVALLEVASRQPSSRSWDRLLRHLARSYRDTGDPSFRLLRCRVLADLDRWPEVVVDAEWLVSEVATYDALRLASFAALRAGQFDRCLTLLASGAHLCSGGALTDELRQLRVSALRSAGRLVEAIADAEARAREGGGTPALLELAQLHLERGDRRELGRVARQLVGRPDLEPDAALRVARIAALDEQAAARQLAEAALEAKLPDAALGEAIEAGLRLGLNRQLGHILNRATAEGGGGTTGPRIVTAEEYGAEWERASQLAAEAGAGYLRGEVPIHFLPANLARCYRAQLVDHEHEPDPLRQPSLLVRDGARPLPGEDRPLAETKRLLLDLTALLLAAHLDLFEPLARRFRTLAIPRSVPLALLALRQESAPPPEEAATRREIVRLLNLGRLGGAPATAIATPNADGSDHRSPQPSALASCGDSAWQIVPGLAQGAESGSATAITPAQLAHALRAAGRLTAEQLRDALTALGTMSQHGGAEFSVLARAPQADATHGPLPGQPLRCDRRGGQLLARAGLLDTACHQWRVALAEGEAAALLGEATADEQGQQLADWLAALQDRVSDGLGKGTVVFAAPRPMRPGEDEATEEPEEDPVVRSFEELLRAEQHPGDAVWADDRHLSRFERAETAPLVGILDILAELAASGAIDAAGRWGAVARLRAGNARFLPLTEEELLHHLALAQLDDAGVVETPELAALRRSFAASLAQHTLLRRPQAGVEIDRGELEFAFRSCHQASGAIVRTWMDAADEREAAARARWLLDQVYLDPLATATAIAAVQPGHDRHQLAAFGLVDLLGGAITTRVGGEPDGRARRRTFFAWLNERLIDPWCRASPRTLAAAVGILGALAEALLDATEDGLPRAAVVARIRLWHEDLPGQVREALDERPGWLARLGQVRRTIVTIGDLTLDEDGADRALAAAMGGETAALRALQPPVEVAIAPAEDEDGVPQCRIVRADTGTELLIAHPDLVLHRPTPESRAAGLRAFPNWFDADVEEREEMIAEIATLPAPRERRVALERRREASTAWHFSSLTRRMSAGERVTLADLLPGDAAGLLRHFRLPAEDRPDELFSAVLERSARSLLASEGLAAAILRLAGLPVPLPVALRAAIAALSVAERRELLRALLRESASPPALAQVARLLAENAGDDPATARQARRLLRRAAGPVGRASCDAFLAVLGWVVDSLAGQAGVSEWSPRFHLAVTWGCADRLYRMSRGLGLPTSAIGEAFADAPDSVRGLFSWDPALALDLAHPRQLRPLALLAAACAYVLGEADTPGILASARRGLAAAPAGRGVVPLDWETRWRGIALVPGEAAEAPTSELVRYLDTARNGLGGWLGAPWGEWLAALLSPDGDPLRPETQRRELVTLAQASSPEEIDGGLIALGILLAELPSPPECAPALSALLSRADYLAIYRRDSALGLYALRMASRIARGVDDTALGSHLRTQLLAVAGEIGRDTGEVLAGEDEDRGDSADSLFDAALVLSQIPAAEPAEIAGRFADLLVELAERWSGCASLFRRGLVIFARRLPDEIAARLWSAQVRLRAL